MASTERNPADRLSALLEELARAPARIEFLQALRRIEAASPAPRLGDGRRSADDPVRLAQDPELDFAAADLTRIQPRGEGRRSPRLFSRFLGLFGPNGPLPLHLTEYARDRERAYDPAFARFADIFHHRLLSLFYKAWRQAQPVVENDRPDEDGFRRHVGATFGYGIPAVANREDDLLRDVRYHFAGLLSRRVRSPDALVAILQAHLGMPACIRDFVPRWIRLPQAQQSRLGGGGSSRLGMDSLAGERMLDAQHHFDIEIGPLSLEDYARLLPGGRWHACVRAWVREFCNETFGVRLFPLLAADEVPTAGLCGNRRLGLDTWAGRRQAGAPARDLALAVSVPIHESNRS